MNLKGKKYLLLDLDGVCYGKHNNYSLERVFGQVSKRMTKFISERLKINEDKAKELQTDYFYKYNTSLRGLIIHNDIPPQEFLKYVHSIDLSFMKEDKIMRSELEQLEMEKFIFTNGSAEHAKNILTHLGVYDLFGRERVFDIQDASYIPKPEAKTFDKMVNKFGINPKETIYIEDIARNLSLSKSGTFSLFASCNTRQLNEIQESSRLISVFIVPRSSNFFNPNSSS